MEVKCPQCGTKTIFAPENPFRPFCSERCRLIDLGEWASGSYRIPIPEDELLNASEFEDENEDSDGGDSRNRDRHISSDNESEEDS